MKNWRKSAINLRESFTLAELVLVIGLIALLSVIAFVGLNPKKQIEKAWDVRRKSELASLGRIFEDYYNDKNAYPDGGEICYDDPVDDGSSTCMCHVCGLNGGKNLSPYLSTLFCDPEYPQKNYLYRYDCSSPSTQWYRACAILSAEGDQNSYNYSSGSPNSDPAACEGIYINAPTSTPAYTPTPTITPTITPTATLTPIATMTPTPFIPPCQPDPRNKYCKKGGACNNCGSFANCGNGTSCDLPPQLFSDFNCTVKCL